MANPKRQPKAIRTLADLKAAFADGTINRDYWCLRVNCHGYFMHYIGPNKSGFEPAEPVRLQLPSDTYQLLAEALELAGVPTDCA